MEDKEGVSGLTLLTVRRQLRLGRKVGLLYSNEAQAIWQHSQRLINDFIDCSKLDNSNTHMVKQIVVNDLCDYFMQVLFSCSIECRSVRSSAEARVLN